MATEQLSEHTGRGPGALEPACHAQARLRAGVACGLGQPTDLALELGSACCELCGLPWIFFFFSLRFLICKMELHVATSQGHMENY